MSDKNSKLNEEDLFKIIQEGNLTDNQMTKICRVLKSKYGKEICPTRIKHNLTERKNVLSSYFELKNLEFEDKKGNKHFKNTVVGKAEKVKETVFKIRNMDPDENITINIVSIDGGKGMLKIVVNFCPFFKRK